MKDNLDGMNQIKKEKNNNQLYRMVETRTHMLKLKIFFTAVIPAIILILSIFQLSFHFMPDGVSIIVQLVLWVSIMIGWFFIKPFKELR